MAIMRIPQKRVRLAFPELGVDLARRGRLGPDRRLRRGLHGKRVQSFDKPGFQSLFLGVAQKPSDV